MNSEVIKLFGENSANGGPEASALTHDIDSFWRMSETLIETRQKFEQPLRKMISRTSELEKELQGVRQTLEQTRQNFEHSQQRVQVLKGQLEKQRTEQLASEQQSTALQKSRQALLAEREKLIAALASERKRANDLSAKVEVATQALETREAEYRKISQTLAQYQAQWTTLVESDRKMREIIHQQQSMIKTRIEEQKILAAAQMKTLEKEVKQLSEDKQALETQLSAATQELNTERMALRTTSEALQNYQTQWNAFINTDRQMRLRMTRLEQELQHYKSLVTRMGPIEDRTLLERRDAESRAELERLRAQLLAKASVERELSEQKALNAELLKEFTRETERYRDLAQQDHANQLALLKKGSPILIARTPTHFRR